MNKIRVLLLNFFDTAGNNKKKDVFFKKRNKTVCFVEAWSPTIVRYFGVNKAFKPFKACMKD